MTTATYTVSTKASENAALYAAIGHFVMDAQVHEALGTAVTTREGDVWVVESRKGVAVSFASARANKNGSWHMRYAYGSGRPALIRKVVALAKEAGADRIWTNERASDADLPALEFKTSSDKKGFVRWEVAL